MAAHRYWKLAEMTSAGNGGYVAGAECYLRQTVGGANVTPVSSTSSSPYDLPASALYDGDSNTWWASNDSPMYVAFDYGTPIDVAQALWQARPDEHTQGLLTTNLYYSDTGLTGPWTATGNSFTFSSWTNNGEVQLSTLTPIPPGISVSEQSGYAALIPSPGLNVSEQSGYAALIPSPGLNVSEQSGYAPIIPPPGLNVSEQSAYLVLLPGDNRRRQVMINTI